MNRGRGGPEDQMIMRAGINIFNAVIWACTTKVLRSPYRSAEPTPEEMTQFQNCMEKHISILKASGNPQQQAPGSGF